ncbi:hypothetical protein [Alcanivorax hongdengensis]|uniref:hypothetical protein n=1 Tax=Alcanivorax hongdengensis TaxID=519051 RepID=UPI0003127FE7|nr:hypothetical protein [Alcanivorax hongdengensis]
MIDVSHGYLTAGLLYLGIWALLFAVSEPFVRVVMLVGGVLFCGLGPLAGC